jgi:hypothetical protein
MNKIFAFSVLGMLAFACKKEKTSWDSAHLIPIVNDTLKLNDLLGSNSPITADANNQAVLSIDNEILSLDPSSIFKIKDTSVIQTYALPVGSITVPPGTVFVNEVKEHVFNIPNVELKAARIKSGKILLKVENPVTTPVNFTVNLPGTSKNGVQFSQTFLAPAKTSNGNGIIEATIDLSEYYLNMTGSTGGSFNKLQTVMIVGTDPNGIPVNLSPTNVVKFTATLKDTVPDYARGYFGQINILRSETISLPQLNNVVGGSLSLNEAKVEIEINNEFKIPASIKLNLLSNTNYSGTSVAATGSNINNDFNLNPATGSWNTLTPAALTILFDEVNSNIPQYIGNLGSSMQVGYNLKINPWGNISGGWNEIFPNTKLKVRIKTSIPLALNFNDVALRDTFAFNLKSDTEKSYISSGRLILRAKNAFPFASNVVLRLLGKDGAQSVVLQPSQAITSGLFGILNPALNVAIAKSENYYVLPESVLLKLQDFDKIEMTATVTSGNSLNNPIHINSFLGIQLFADIIYKTKF